MELNVRVTISDSGVIGVCTVCTLPIAPSGSDPFWATLGVALRRLSDHSSNLTGKKRELGGGIQEPANGAVLMEEGEVLLFPLCPFPLLVPSPHGSLYEVDPITKADTIIRFFFLLWWSHCQGNCFSIVLTTEIPHGTG